MDFIMCIEFLLMLISGGCVDGENPTVALIAFAISTISLGITADIKEKRDAKRRPKHRKHLNSYY